MIKWKGPTLDPSGYGTANRDYIYALNSIGANITVAPWNWEAQKASFYGEAGELVESLKNRNIDYDFVIHHYVPNQIQNNIEKGKINVGYSTWETDKIPPHWVDNINNCFDLQLVPSHWNKQTYKASGVKIPIEVVPHCLDTTPFEQAEVLEMPEFENCFKFLSVFQWIERKNPFGLLKAYFSEFTGHDDVVLLLKTYGSSTSEKEKNRLKQMIAAIKRDVNLKHYPPVYFLSDLLSREEMYSLYKTADCFVLPTRGEGFGIPFAEACAAENTVIAPKYGGQTDFLKEPFALLTSYFLTPVAHMYWIPHYNATMNWAEPNLNETKLFMRQMYEHSNSKRLDEWKKAGKEYMKKTLNYEKVGKLFLQKLKEFQND